MATRVLPFTVTIPAGTLQSAPYTQAINLDGWQVERVDLEVPSGPQGLMGFQIFNNGVAWIPYGSGQWIIWNDKKESYYLTDQPSGSGWAVVGYNVGAYPHSVTVRFHVSPASTAESTTTTPTVTITTTDTPTMEPVTL